jgi:hypothetical protein
MRLNDQGHPEIEAGTVNLNQGISASGSTLLGPTESENGLGVWPKRVSRHSLSNRRKAEDVTSRMAFLDLFLTQAYGRRSDV